MTETFDNGGYLTLQIRLLNGRLFNRLLAADGRALYSAEQGKILSSLWKWAPMTATDLALKTGLANNTLTAMLKRLEDKGLIKSSSHPKDKRKRLFDLTELGRSQEEVGAEVSQQLDAIFYKGFSQAERAEVEGYLMRILQNLQEVEDSERWKKV
ncbi:MarR family winged helix-turn-helix transcriptional regulator [Streptococcus massiliensis]|uniref:SlyA-like protein n=1 Tax=Streptococcus massiliensis TaxID=313439 RepID=A0A380L185_9STRE|nr:MarR family transcriptional regulator [Streptococcus massiliensis]SUN77532.1 SlyA-like protein [Streptococcus massiliensis]